MLKFCVLGSGISYTLSPLIHNTVFGELGVKAVYGVEDIPPEKLDDNIPRLRETYDGFNVTKPHKLAIIPYLDKCNTALGAVNTVKRRCNKWTGDNTDVYGFKSDLLALTTDVKNKRILVLGAGGAAEAAVRGLTDLGGDVTVLNRTESKAIALAGRFGAKGTGSAVGLKPEIIVNCTSVGNDGKTSPVPEALDKSALAYAYDLVYSPSHTAFMRECEKAGAKTSNGLGMLIRQAIRADEIFLGKTLDEPELYQVILNSLKRKE